MSAQAEKMLSNALNVFNAKLSDRQVIKLEGMEDYLKVPHYKTLVNLEKQASQLEMDAVMRIMNSKIAYLTAAHELNLCEKRWLQEIRNGMDALEERDRLVKEVNMKMRKGDYSMLQPAPAPVPASEPRNSPRKAAVTTAKPPIHRRPETERPVPPPTSKPEISDLKKRLAMINMNDTPSARQPLTTINVNKTVEITSTPKIGSMLSSKGSLDGSVVPNRAPVSPLSPSKWDVPAPNFDETIDTEPINPRLRVKAPTHLPLPSALLNSTTPEEADNHEDTFPLVQPSLPFQTPTVPKSRPFLLSSMRKESAKADEPAPPPSSTLRPRPVPTPVSARPSDPLSTLGLMKLKRPVLNSEVGKKLMGQL